MRLTIFLFLCSATCFAQYPIEVSKIAKGVYVHTSYQDYGGNRFPSNGLIVETNKSVFLIDTGWGEDATQQLYRWVKENLHKPVVVCIPTHSHDDRTGGVKWLQQNGVKVFAHTLTNGIMKQKDLGVADHELPADSTFVIDNIKVETYFPGPGHSPDNIVVWLPKEKILFGGCFLKSVQAMGLGNLADANTQVWPQSIENVKQKFPNPALTIPGHQSWLDNTSANYTLKLLKEKEANGN